MAINLISDTINREDINSLCEWLQQDPTPRLTKGALTVELERKWAKLIGTRYSVYVNSGSSAIFLSLLALRDFLGHPLKVVVPALSWATDVSSPMILGCEVQLCDCNMRDLSCDLDQLKAIFSQFRPDVFISVSPLGLIPDMERLVALCERYSVVLIEDNCESAGSKIGDKMLGSFGEMSLFSMYYGHHLSTIEGGFINTNSPQIYNRLLAMRSHGWSRDLSEGDKANLRQEWSVDSFSDLYTFYYPAMNLRSTDLQAFIGLRMLGRLEEYSLKRNINFHTYRHNIHNNELDISERPDELISNFAYPMAHKKRDAIVRDLMSNNIETRPLIAGSMARQPMWVSKFGSQHFEVADYLHQYGFYLPNHQNLTEEDILRVTEIINKY